MRSTRAARIATAAALLEEQSPASGSAADALTAAATRHIWHRSRSASNLPGTTLLGGPAPHAIAAASRSAPAMGLVHERLLNATYWKEIIGDAPEEGVDPLILKLFAGVMLLWVLFGPCLTYAVELSGRRRKRLKID